MKKSVLFILFVLLSAILQAKDIKELTKIANAGDKVAQSNLGICYLTGDGVAKDYKQAVYWFKKSAEQGMAKAQYNLGVCYSEGLGLAQDHEKAVYWLEQAAKQENPKSQFALGTRYFYGKGVEMDYKQAVYWLKKAAEQGVVKAQHLLGVCYGKGLGLARDFEQAAYWFEQAAEQGVAEAQFSLGVLLLSGTGIVQDQKQAVYWFKQASEQGNPNGQYNLGDCYYHGYGIGRDYEQAVYWYKKAAEQGNSGGQHGLGNCYYTGHGIPQNFKQAVYWYKMAAEKGNSDSQYGLGNCYFYGKGIEKDYKQAAFWFEQAAEQNNTNVYDILGWCYDQGLGVSQDLGKAEKLYKQASDNNNPSGYNNLALLYANGRGVVKNIEKAYELINKAIEINPREGKYLDSKGEIALIAKDYPLAQQVFAELQTKFPDLVKRYSNSNEDVFVRTMINGINDIDFQIPEIADVSANTFALIIANENYSRVAEVPYAKNDGNTFASYCKKTLGLPEKHVTYIENATLADIKYSLDKMKQIADAYDGNAKFIFYYAGHGVPSEDQQSAYILPADGYNGEASGISLSELYKTFNEMNMESAIILLDACFSGTERNDKMLASARGVAIKPKMAVPVGNVVVLSAASGDQTAYPDKEKRHGLFTYYLLKKLQESQGGCTLGELSDYIISNVKKRSIVDNGKLQTPMVNAPANFNWRNLKLK